MSLGRVQVRARVRESPANLGQQLGVTGAHGPREMQTAGQVGALDGQFLLDGRMGRNSEPCGLVQEHDGVTVGA